MAIKITNIQNDEENLESSENNTRLMDMIRDINHGNVHRENEDEQDIEEAHTDISDADDVLESMVPVEDNEDELEVGEESVPKTVVKEEVAPAKTITPPLEFEDARTEEEKDAEGLIDTDDDDVSGTTEDFSAPPLYDDEIDDSDNNHSLFEKKSLITYSAIYLIASFVLAFVLMEVM